MALVAAGVLIGQGAVAGAASAAPAGTAAVTQIASWQMNEPAGATVMTDSSPNALNGSIGSRVRTGVAVAGSLGYSFPAANTTTVDPLRLVTVADDARLDPGTRGYSIVASIRTAAASGNIVQKGQAGVAGGFYKLEMVDGIALCSFRGATGLAVAGSATRVDDGKPHTLTCLRTAAGISLQVDAGAVRRNPKASGAIANAAPVTIGGKQQCNAAATSCDYFTGVVNEVRLGTV